MSSKQEDSVNSGLKHIKKCQKGSRPPPMALTYSNSYPHWSHSFLVIDKYKYQ